MNYHRRVSPGSLPAAASSAVPSNRPNTSIDIENVLPSKDNDPMLSASSANNHSLLSFGRNGEDDHPADSNTPYDFLPSVSFDDLHSSIESASTDFKLTQFPSPTGEGSILDAQGLMNRDMAHSLSSQPGTAVGVPNGRHPPTATAGRAGRSSSILRRPSTSSRQSAALSSSTNSNSSAQIDAPTAPAAMRNRRQSHYPPVSNVNTNIAKPPRKSIGPGVIGDSSFDVSRNPSRRRPSLYSDRGNGNNSRSSVDGGSAGFDSGRSYAETRAFKAKSVQPPPRSAQAQFLADNTLTPEQNRHSVLPPRSPRVGGRGLTPSSSGIVKRASMMPGAHGTPPHLSGLGARTISPTDTKRMQRMSILPGSQSLSQVTNVPPPPPISTETRAESRSPSMIPRKASATPSSARTTPDITRKSYSSGLSIGSAASFNTVRTSTGSLQPRLPVSASTSRLPAPKLTTVHNPLHNDDDEDVPPVPAIPKAYESPKDSPADAYFTEKKKTALNSFESAGGNSTGSITMPVMPEPTKVQRKPSARKSSFMPMSTSAMAVDKRGSTQSTRKNLQPLSLPPINLAPINLPSSMKVPPLPQPPAAGRDLSPPPSRQLPRTPTTPMTASKSAFFSKSRYDETMELPDLRSSSSIHHTHHMSPTPPAVGTSSSSSIVEEPNKSSISPFLSSSAPKGGFEPNFLRRPKTSGDPTTAHGLGFDDQAFQKPAGPRPQNSERIAPKSPTPAPSTNEEPPTPSSISSLRRKLSLSWKRGSSKSGINPPADVTDKAQTQSQPQPQTSAKQDSMPPPRIPVSATVNNLANIKQSSPAPTGHPSNGYLESRRRKSSGASLNSFPSHERTKSETWTNKKESSVEPTPMPTSRNPLIMHKIVKPRVSSSSIRSAEAFTATELDKDDKAAEDEMRKLGSRRKETEVAARTIDQLRKRATPKDRVGAHEAIRIAMLNIYERGEIVDYTDVYFCGTQNARKVVGDVHSDAPNFGYDDERGDYTIVPGDHLSYRYEIIDVLGKGSFGQVVRCIDHKLGVLVAVKIIRNKKRFHQQALVEVNILQKLREWDPKNKHSMVNFTQSFYFRGHLCISTELLDMNLYELIKAHSFRGFSLRIIRRFTKQILSSLNLLKQHKVIHCDLKPENILLRHPLHAEIKVIDFGSSCFENEKVYTYIQSRFYRSPEVILGMTYGLPIDMWSVGCILAELYTGVPIFPGENEQEQLACIMEVFGPPEKHLIEKSTRKKLFFDSMGKPRLTVSSKGRRRRPSSKTLQQAIKCDDEAFLDFLARCLRWDPDRRMKPEEAIRHEFITGHKPVTSLPRMAPRDASPIKRHNTISSAPRPLPEPPANMTIKTVGSMRSGPSPHKPVTASSRRVSGATAPTAASTNRRTSTGMASVSSGLSSLPRASNRTASGKQDLAAAGATAAMNRRP
ncbi:hypothetical protein NLU13_5576 [Sarocladium strictum]|uniref:Protein kinase domain-containing protein n=1 Tax=Sarocladium strictum TaxID=5046 RepID=A0AA39GH56_SARSR|nr:hypothetical protein NLU13_5576 [Sarocladium strictum]